MYTIGIDFGTESGRALLVDARNGRVVATRVMNYPHGVIDEHLPNSDKPLPPDWALQDPLDYLTVLNETVPAVLRESGIPADQILGIGIDFTTCTLLPTLADGTPLRTLPHFASNPHSWVKLWKHHGSVAQAAQIDALAAQRGEAWMSRYSGKSSSEWFFAKALQILQEAPEIYHAAEKIIESGDWLVWQLTGVETRNACMAGYKAFWQNGSYPSRDFLAALHPDFADIVGTKVPPHVHQLGERAGGLTAHWATQLGLRAGTPVAVSVGDAHAAVPGLNTTRAGIMTLIMGTSICHLMSEPQLQDVAGLAGVVEGGLVSGLVGYEAGQTGGGDIFAWFVDHAVPPTYHEAAKAAGMNLHAWLEGEAARQRVGEHGLIALDWWNGNRSTLQDADMSGMIVGMTLGTRAPDIYRAMIEATAFGTLVIIEAFEAQGLQVKELVAAGGLPEKNVLLRQIYADVTGRDFKLARRPLASGIGAAIYAAVAAGLYSDIHAASDAMGKVEDAEIVSPNPANQAAYRQLYADYKTLYDYFGRGSNDVMRRLKAMKRAHTGSNT
jgi:L-ribulokinase